MVQLLKAVSVLFVLVSIYAVQVVYSEPRLIISSKPSYYVYEKTSSLKLTEFKNLILASSGFTFASVIIFNFFLILTL